jgi:hypothetical protein
MVRAVTIVSSALTRAPALSLLFCLISTTTAWAHGKSLSYSSWNFSGEQTQVSVRIPLLELSRLGIPLPLPNQPQTAAHARRVGEYLAEHLELLTPAGNCTRVSAPVLRPSKEGWVRFRWSLRCPPGADQTIRSRILLDQAPSHLHFARASLEDDPGTGPSRIVERVLTHAEPNWRVDRAQRPADGRSPPAEPASASFGRYLRLGVEHILSGWDHLAFVLALILLAGSLGEVARLVTGFTVAHSLTLALAVLGWIRIESGPVEALIGFSVALIALENGWALGGRGRWIPRLAVGSLMVLAAASGMGFGALSVLTLLGLALFSASHFELLRRQPDANLHRVALAFAFGLIHGFGFAGVLAEMTLPTAALASALLGFNLGVEAGQLFVVALIWPILVGLRRVAGGRPHRVLAEIASAGICATGIYWFLVRSLPSP